MEQEEIKIVLMPTENGKEPQMSIILYPKDSYYKFDCVRVKLKDMEGTLKFIDMTPDEALHLSGLLNNAVNVFFYTNKEYKKWLAKEKKIDLTKHKVLKVKRFLFLENGKNNKQRMAGGGREKIERTIQKNG